jgi:hypothetical protein
MKRGNNITEIVHFFATGERENAALTPDLVPFSIVANYPYISTNITSSSH